MKNISENITWAEATHSNTAIAFGLTNMPTSAQLANMERLAENVFEPLRSVYGPIRVSSFFRSIVLNKKIGGSATSQHCTGEAMDIQATGDATNADLFNYIRTHLPFDQLIWEFGSDANPDWVHVSLSTRNRKQVLKATRVKGRTIYINI